jgi:hypothetical protein
MGMHYFRAFQFQHAADPKSNLRIGKRRCMPATIPIIKLVESLDCSLKPMDPNTRINFEICLIRMFDGGNCDPMSAPDKFMAEVDDVLFFTSYYGR